MALTKWVDFEEGSNGSAIVVGGNYSAVSGSVVYSTAAASRGVLGMLATNGGYVTVPTLSVDNGSFSVDFELPTTTTGVPRIITFTDSGTAFIGMVRAHTDGKFDIANGASTRVAASVNSWATATRYRLDGYLGGSGLARTVTLEIRRTSDETLIWSVAAQAITSNTANAWSHARPGMQGASVGTVRLDNVRFFDTQVIAGPPGSIVSGTLVASLGGPTATATGLRTGHGSGAAALSGPTATLAGSRTVHASAVATLPGPAATIAGGVEVLGTGSAALPGTTATAAGLRTGHGSGAAVLGTVTATLIGTGSAAPTMTAQLPGVQALAAGLREGHGSGAASLPAVSAGATGLRLVGGSGEAVLGQVQAAVIVVAVDPFEDNWLTLEDLMYARETQEEVMFDRVRIRHDEPTDGAFDPALGFEPSAYPDPHYDGPARVQAKPIQSGTQTSAEEVITTLGYVVAIPWHVTTCRPTDIIEVYQSYDPLHLDKVLRVSDVQSSTFVTARRMSCVDYQQRAA